jgi:glycosyltransferase involved in cell wall biosynthesis
MGKRIKIGIVYSYDENWIGGTYYYQYLIKSLNLLPNSRKPHLVILSNKTSHFESIKALSYPYLTCCLLVDKPSVLVRLKNVIANNFRVIKRQFEKEINLNIDVLFHPSEISIPNTIKKHLYWIPDFQEHYLPELFSKEYLNYRKVTQEKLLSKDKHILFSSKDAQNDFNKIYPQAASHTYVVNFAVFHPNYDKIELQVLKKEFVLPEGKYFFSPNQFWKHKNHMVVLKAIKELKNTVKIEPLVYFSGKEHDYRNPTYFADLKEYVNVNGLKENVRFLGFIDRSEQLCLMNNAIVIIQPSFFEGWSSVVEDAKAMSQNVIVSSLNVHKEQLGDKGYFFKPNDVKELVDYMRFFLDNIIAKPQFNYSKNQGNFAVEFMDVVKKLF